MNKPDNNSFGRTMLKWLGALALAASLAGCATTRPPMIESFRQAPATGQVGAGEYRLPRLVPQSGNSDSLAVILSFSGGGTRAAAFAYGVLKELKNAPVLWNGAQTTLLDEVDVVAGVSGGSVAAAYFAAFGDETFRSFEPAFLKSDFQGGLLSRVRSPANAFRLSSPWFGRGHLLAERLDETLFRGITYGDLAARGTRPYLLVTATDLTQGTGFEFSQGQFDLLCSRLDRVPLSLAVAASSAVPVVMSPVTLENKAGKCAAPLVPAVNPRLAAADAYLDPEQRPFIHLVDGGLSDNLAVRGIIDAIAHAGGMAGALETSGLQGIRRLVIVSVNAEQGLNTALDRSDKVPSVAEVLDAISSAMLAHRSSKSREILDRGAARWRSELRAAARAGSQALDPSVDLYVIEVSLQDHPEPKLRGELLAIPTSFSLPTEEVDKLIAAGGKILRESAEFMRLRNDLSIDKAQ
ncbi:MAG: patatin [Betaproteobacteria bacterium HGW-Betaproteobacteria-14]|nr:MAG: patatin [Betaproteobacteria bacterium HGW-Betaproteobacteria-14]PKO91169.1 MAG: patatin [Betaproteobacteria bacterium HGW-Betaproteobacteria-10]